MQRQEDYALGRQVASSAFTSVTMYALHILSVTFYVQADLHFPAPPLPFRRHTSQMLGAASDATNRVAQVRNGAFQERMELKKALYADLE